MNFLKLLPLSKGKMDVLLEIYAETDYLRSISKKLRLNPSYTFILLHQLHDAQVIVQKKKGKEVEYSLTQNRDYNLLVKLLEEYHLEKVIEKSNVLKVLINLVINNKELMNSSHNLYLFGSYVLGDYTEDSDIDILFVTEKRKLVGKACREISIIVGKELNPLIYTPKKFRLDLAASEPLLSSIVKNVKNRAVVK